MLCLGIICLPVCSQFLPAVLLAVFPALIPYHYASLALHDSRIYQLGLQDDISVHHRFTENNNIITDENIIDSKFKKRTKIKFNPPNENIQNNLMLEKSWMQEAKISGDGDDKPVFSGQSINSGGSLLLDKIDGGMVDRNIGQGVGKEYL